MYFIKIKFISNPLSCSFSSGIFLRMFKIIKRINKIRKEERNKIKKKLKKYIKRNRIRNSKTTCLKLTRHEFQTLET